MPEIQNPNGPQGAQMNIDLKDTTAIATPDGVQVFQQGVILRKVSKFVAGTNEDAVMPIPVFFEPATGKLVESTIPLDLREELKDIIIPGTDTIKS
jgi:hypothetical protein